MMVVVVVVEESKSPTIGSMVAAVGSFGLGSDCAILAVTPLPACGPRPEVPADQFSGDLHLRPSFFTFCLCSSHCPSFSSESSSVLVPRFPPHRHPRCPTQRAPDEQTSWQILLRQRARRARPMAWARHSLHTTSMGMTYRPRRRPVRRAVPGNMR